MKKKGFTLPELMVVVLVIAVLMAIATPMFISAKNRSQARACQANLQIIKSAIKEWALDNPATAIANYEITTANLDPYIDGTFSSLKEPTTNSSNDYLDNGPSDAGVDYVVKINADGTIPNPTCNTGLTGHSI